MKKIIFSLIAVVLLVVSACEPLEDINKDIDKLQDQQKKNAAFIANLTLAPEAYTLKESDYELSSNENVAQYKNFSDDALPKDYLPEILYQLFYGEAAQELTVTYNFYKRPTVDMDNAHEISEEEYDEMGQYYGNFSDEDEAEYAIGKLFDGIDRYKQVEAGSEKTAMYVLYESGATRYIKVNADKSTEVLDYASDAYALTDQDYEDLGEGTYKNFYTISDAEEKVVELAEMREHTLPKTYSCTVYRNYFDTYAVFRHDGMNWLVAQSLNSQSEPLNYSLDETNISNSYWWADPAIKITLGQADYDLFDETSNYQNFDLRSGKVPGEDVAKRVEMIGAMLDANHAPIIEGQQYLVSYAFYNGSNGIGNDRLVKTDGVWSMYKEPK